MKDSRGFSLIEVTVAVAIFALVLVSVLPLFPQSLTWAKSAETEVVSGYLLARVAHDLRTNPEPLALDTLLAGERIYTTADGSLSAYPDYGHVVRVTATPDAGLYQLHIEVLSSQNQPVSASYVYVGGVAR